MNPINLSLLEKPRLRGGKLIARCPACAAEGSDKKGEHFFQNPTTHAFGCVKHPGDREHRREIFRLVGITRPRDPEKDREWRREQKKEKAQECEKAVLVRAMRAKRDQIFGSFPWTQAEVLADSPEKRPAHLSDPRLFLAALFRPDDIVWTGKPTWSGTNGDYAERWRAVEAWQDVPPRCVGPMVSPGTWPEGTLSRTKENVKSAPYVVLDFDGFDRVEPRTGEELKDHVAKSLSVVRWLREDREWQLAALLFTGSKSIHAWFHTPPPDALQSLRDVCDVLGVDRGLLGNPEHPCRLPGWPHQKTGIPSRVLWLQNSI